MAKQYKLALFWKVCCIRMTPTEGHVSSSWMWILLNGFQAIADSDPELMVDGKGVCRHGEIWSTHILFYASPCSLQLLDNLSSFKIGAWKIIIKLDVLINIWDTAYVQKHICFSFRWLSNIVVPFIHHCLFSSLLLNDVERCALRYKRVKYDILKIITEMLVWRWPLQDRSISLLWGKVKSG